MNLKYFSVPTVLFGIFYIVWSNAKVLACPACMRKELFQKALQATVLSNLLAPVMWMKYAVAFGGTFVEGHSLDAEPFFDGLRERGPFVPPRPASAGMGRVIVCLAILIVICLATLALGYFMGNP